MEMRTNIGAADARAIDQAARVVARGFVQPEYRNEKGDPFAAEVAVAAAARPYDRFAGFLGRMP